MQYLDFLQDDLNELVKRIRKDGFVSDKRKGKPDILSTAFSLPTLAERGKIDETKQLAEVLLNSRDEEGGWDDDWNTIISLEGLVGLKLRGFQLDELDDAIKQAVTVLKGIPAQSSADQELRLSRSLVLAGLALNEAKMIDVGLLRVRAVLDKGFSDIIERSEAIHGLLSLADLHTITKDPSIKVVLDKRIEFHELSNPDQWAEGEDVSVVACAGTILEKTGNKTAAQKVFEIVSDKKPSSLDSISLKHRTELAVRLFDPDSKHVEQNNADEKEKSSKKRAVENQAKPGKPEPGEASKEQENRDITPELTKKQIEESDAKIPSGEISGFPAYQSFESQIPSVSVIVLQRGDGDDLKETLTALSRQSVKSFEVVVIALPGTRVNLNRLTTSSTLRIIIPSALESEGERWNRALDMISGDWTWIIPSGIIPDSGTLKKMLKGVADDIDAIHLSDRKEEFKQVFIDIQEGPSIQPERSLIRSSILQDSRFNDSMNAEPLWRFILDGFITTWQEVVTSNNAGFSGESPQDLRLLAYQAADIYEIERTHPAKDTRVNNKRLNNALFARRVAYEEYRRHGKPLVSIIIPHYNLPDMLETCIKSVLENTQQIPFELIVVDNGSDNTTEEMIDKFDDYGVLYLRNRKNEGFARACNRGAREAKGDYLVFLNNDTEVQLGWLRAMMRGIDEEPDVGIVGARLLFPNRTIQHTGIAISSDLLPAHIYSNAPANLPNVLKRRFYQAVTAACMLVKRELFLNLNGFDEKYKNGFEDVDFCLRSRQKNFRVLYEPEAVVIHHSEQTPGRKEHDVENAHLFLDRWSGILKSDFQMYAEMDGFKVEEKEGSTKLIPINPQLLINAEEEGRLMDKELKFSEPNLAEDTIVREKPENEEESLLDLLSRADMMIKDGRFTDAEQTLIGGAKRVNGNVHQRAMYWTLLGDARFRLNRAEEAFTCYKKAVSDDPSIERAWIGIGTYHLINDELEKAEDIFTKIIKLAPDYDRGYMGIANVQLKRGKYDEAIRHFKEASRLTPDHRPAIVGLVAAAVQAGKLMEAQPSVERYLKIHPDDFEARFHHAALLYGGKEIQRAKQEALVVLESAPDHHGAKELLEHIES